MGLKKNIAYNSLLSISNYIIPLIVFPYVTRILGVKNFGIYSFVDSAINYYLIFSMMGILTIGVREIAKNKNNPIGLSKTFSSLFVLNFISTFIVLIFFIISIYTIPQFNEQKNIFLIGGAKIFFNLFLIEWLYIGTENFRFITIRSIIIRLIYVLSIFVFVKNSEDYDIYYSLTVGTLVFNAIINWIYGKNITRFTFKNLEIKPYIKPFLVLGIYGLLTSMYTGFNTVYLGLTGGDKEVGYYSTAIKIQGIILSLYTAYSGVVMPHVSSMLADNKMEDVKSLISKSFNLLFLFAIPIIFVTMVLAPQIIFVLSGVGYEGAITPMRIVMPLLLIIGIEQILIVQILTPMRQDRAILINSIIGAIVGLLLNILLVGKFKSTGSASVWVVSEFIVFLSAQYFVRKSSDIIIDYRLIIKHLFFGIPYILISLGSLALFKSPLIVLLVTILFSIFYFIIIQSKVFYKIITNK